VAVEDYLDSHVAVAVAATAAIFSPRARKMLRRGAVYGVTGVLMASDAISAAARNAKAGLATDGTTIGASDQPPADAEGTGNTQPTLG
jgi:hypothetical protein